MWADNETDVDLLGFDYMVDEIVSLIANPDLLPLTIGLTGDWGSGKSSILKMAARAVEDDRSHHFLVVRFNPWAFGGYEDMKIALMAAVMKRINDEIGQDETGLEHARDLVARLIRRVRWFQAAKAVIQSAAAVHAGLPPDLVNLAGTEILKPPSEGAEEESAYESVAEFREDFERLMENLSGVDALVVFVDDLDRCLSPTIVQTFEAIRLFLSVPKTAYVIAADERIVQDAVERHYPSAVAKHPILRADYLEKVLQIKVGIPPLTGAEAETYINLLLAQVSGISPENFEALRARAALQRRESYSAVAMNHGIAQETLGTLDDLLTAAFHVASGISPTLARRTRGTPREIKRFLNTLLLRQGAAQRRGLTLDLGVLAKFSLLEKIDLSAFQTLFDWQVRQNGQPRELAFLEDLAQTGEEPPADLEEAATSWLANADLSEWLRLEPQLTDVDLRPYFQFARDSLVLKGAEERLEPALQRLLTGLNAEGRRRDGALREANDLAPEGRKAIYPTLLSRVERSPDEPAMDSAIEMAAADRSLVTDLVNALGRIAVGNIAPGLPLRLATRFRGLPPEFRSLMQRWEHDGDGPLQESVRSAREVGQRQKRG